MLCVCNIKMHKLPRQFSMIHDQRCMIKYRGSCTGGLSFWLDRCWRIAPQECALFSEKKWWLFGCSRAIFCNTNVSTGWLRNYKCCLSVRREADMTGSIAKVMKLSLTEEISYVSVRNRKHYVGIVVHTSPHDKYLRYSPCILSVKNPG